MTVSIVDPAAAGVAPKEGEPGYTPDPIVEPKDNSPVSAEEHRKVISESIKRKEKLRELETQAEAQAESFKTLQAQVGELQTALKGFEGVDPEKYQTLVSKDKERERSELESKGEYQRILDQVGKEHESALAKIKDERDTGIAERDAKVAALASQIGNLTIGREFSDSEFVREELTLTAAKARQVWGSQFEVNEEGQVVGYDLPRGAENRTPLVDAKGKPLPFTEALKRIVESDPEKDQLIRSKIKAGAGSTTEGGKVIVAQQKNARQKIASGIGSLTVGSGPTL